LSAVSMGRLWQCVWHSMVRLSRLLSLRLTATTEYSYKLLKSFL